MKNPSHDSLQGSVGPRHTLNHAADVTLVQKALNAHRSVTRQVALPEDGIWSDQMYTTIHRFQAEIGISVKRRDGTVRPHSVVWKKLQTPAVQAPADVFPWKGTKQSDQISDFEFAEAAKLLKCEQAAIRAIAKQEGGPLGAFDSQGRPVLAFERHRFRKYTDDAYTKEYPQISGPPYKRRKKGEKPANPDDYYPSNGNDGAYARLLPAYTLDPSAALESASWGLFQQMADEYSDLGFTSVKDFVDAMYASVNEHFKVLRTRLLRHSAERNALVQKDWVAFAQHYNGDAVGPGGVHSKDVYGKEIKEKYEAIVKANPEYGPPQPAKGATAAGAAAGAR